MAPEVKSSEELSILTIAWRSLGLAETARLRRVTKWPAEGTGLLRKRKNKISKFYSSYSKQQEDQIFTSTSSI